MKLVEKIRSASLPVKYTVIVTYTRVFQVMLKTMSQEDAMDELYRVLYTEVPDK